MADPGGADPMKLGDLSVVDGIRSDDRGGDHFAAPLGSSRSGRLRFTAGAHRVVVRADPRVRGLYRARFGERAPAVGVRGGVVTIGFPKLPADAWFDHRSEMPAEISLNARIPWDIEVRGGASRFRADLLDLRLGSLAIEGGAGLVEMELPLPAGTVAVTLIGGASNIAIHRPEGITARLRVEGGATHLRLDDRRVGAAGGELDLRGQGYDRVADRYDVTVTGGANNLSVESGRGAKDQGPGAPAWLVEIPD